MPRLDRRHWLLGLAGLGCGTARAQDAADVSHAADPGGGALAGRRAARPDPARHRAQPGGGAGAAGGGGEPRRRAVAWSAPPGSPGSRPDGYSWLFTTASHTNIPPFNDNAGYDPVRDFTHVTLAAQNFGQVLVVHPALPVASLGELLALARREPGRLTYANAGNGTASHIPAELLKTMTGTDILSVPYRGVAEATTDLLAGRVDMFFVGTQIALQHVQDGRLRALALTGGRRWAGMPAVPTMAEAGIPGFEVVNWFGLWMPAGVAPAITAKVHAAVATAVREPEVRRQFEILGLEGVAMPPEPFARFVADQARIAQEIGRRVQGRPG